MLCFDPQTSGGLLLAVPRSEIAAFLKRAEEIGQPAGSSARRSRAQGLKWFEFTQGACVHRHSSKDSPEHQE